MFVIQNLINKMLFQIRFFYLGLKHLYLPGHLLLRLGLRGPGVLLDPLGNGEGGLCPGSLILVLLADRFVKIGSQSGTENPLSQLLSSFPLHDDTQITSR